MDYLFNHSRRSSDFDVFVAGWAFFIKHKPVFDTQFAKKFVAVIAFLGVTTHFEANLTQKVISECLINLKHRNTISVIANV